MWTLLLIAKSWKMLIEKPLKTFLILDKRRNPVDNEAETQKRLIE